MRQRQEAQVDIELYSTIQWLSRVEHWSYHENALRFIRGEPYKAKWDWRW